MHTVLDTPSQIEMFGLVALRGALRLELVGMKKRGQSALSIAKAQGYKGNRAAIIAQIQARIDSAKKTA